MATDKIDMNRLLTNLRYLYNHHMNVVVNEWRVSTARAREIQTGLANRVVRQGALMNPRSVAGVDISVNRWAKTGTGAVVVLSYPELEIIESRVVTGGLEFPYVPGLLTFREAPLIINAVGQLRNKPDFIIVDGQGIAHPRRIGLASHLGLLLDIPTIGCAKSRLIGEFTGPDEKAGKFSELRDNGEVIGAVLRTRSGVKPLFISIGHKIDLNEAVGRVLSCCRGYRLPEPTRLAHQAAGGHLPEKSSWPEHNINRRAISDAGIQR